MTTIRTKHNRENPFAQINRKSLWDDRLSIEAVGLWVRLISRPDDWQINVKELMKSCRSGKDKIYRILNELIECGYVYRHQLRTVGKRAQQFDKIEYFVFETLEERDEFQKSFTLAGFADAELSRAENTDHTNIEPNLIPILRKKEIYKEPSPEEKGSKISRVKFGKFVEFSDQEYQGWVTKLGQEATDSLIEEINDYVANHKPYKDYSAAMRTFLRNKKNKPKSPIQEKIEERVDRSIEKQAYLKEMLRVNPDLEKYCKIWSECVEVRENYRSNVVVRISFSEVSFRQMFESELGKREIIFTEISR